MSEIKHTPGPWITRQQYANRWLIEKDQGENEAGEKLVPLGLASVHTTILEVGCSNENTEANARLIAAAPDLLVVAKDFEEALGELHMFCECGEADCRTTRLRAAIAKATGAQS
jgi:hypothetical protein